MTDKTLIIVEGKEDKNFLESYIKNLGYSDEVFNIQQAKGKDNLKEDSIRNEIENALDRGSQVLIIFDANSDHESTKTGIEHTIERLEGFNIFLFPDDNSGGTVENLLEKIVKSEYERIFECFEEYKQCISEGMSEYELPDIKAKIYAYKQVLGILETPFDPQYWDFENSALDPLRNFLTQNLSNDFAVS